MHLLFVLQKSKLKFLPQGAEQEDSTPFIVLTLVSVVAMVGVLLASSVIYCLRHTSHSRLQEKLSGVGDHSGPDATAAYQVWVLFVPSVPSGSFIHSLQLLISIHVNTL